VVLIITIHSLMHSFHNRHIVMKTPQTTLTQETWVDVRFEVFTVMKFQVAFWVMTMW